MNLEVLQLVMIREETRQDINKSETATAVCVLVYRSGRREVVDQVGKRVSEERKNGINVLSDGILCGRYVGGTGAARF